MADRYFISSTANFDYLGAPDTRVGPDIYAAVFINGSSTPDQVVAFGAGIAENEFAVGQYEYDIVDLEISTTGTIVVNWYAHEFTTGSEVDDFPLVTNPTPVTTTSTPMTVSSSTPTAAATDVSTRDALAIVFSSALQASTMEPHRIILRVVGTTVTINKSVYISSANNATLIVKPLVQLQENVTFELLIPNDALYSAGGAQLASDYTLRFTTGGDTFTTVEEATSEGVIERAAPLIVATTVVAGSATVAVVESTTPIQGAYNFTGESIVFVFDGPVDAHSATATFEWTPLFGLVEFYALGALANLHLWEQLTDPTFPTVDSITFLDDTVTVNLTGPLVGNANLTVTLSGVDTFDSGTYTIYTAVQAATTADIASSYAADQFTGAPTTLDGYTLEDGDRILVKNQSTALENGLYVATDASIGTWDRAADMDASAEVLEGAYVYVENGTVNEGLRYTITSTDPHVLNTDDIDWSLFSYPADLIDDYVLEFTTTLYPYFVGVPEVRNLLRGTIAADITDADIAHLITNIGINLLFIYGPEAKHLLRCVILHTAALSLFDDWLSSEGANESKTLGAFSVKKGPAAGTFAAGPYGRLKDALEKCYDTLNAKYAGMKTGIKSISNYLERPDYRIRGWRLSTPNDINDDENLSRDRNYTIPGFNQEWT